MPKLQHPDFDIVLTNAGGPPPGDFRNWDRDAWLRALDANMLSPIAIIKQVVDGMVQRGFGRIINTTSSAVKSPVDELGLSTGARSGLTGTAAWLMRIMVAKGVIINNILPGTFDAAQVRATALPNTPPNGWASSKNSAQPTPFYAAPMRAILMGKIC